MNPVFVVLMGVGTVFFGLICIIILSTAMSAVCRAMGGTPAPMAAAPAAPAAVSAAIPNPQAMIAAIAAASAEEGGTEMSGIRVLSVKKL